MLGPSAECGQPWQAVLACTHCERAEGAIGEILAHKQTIRCDRRGGERREEVRDGHVIGSVMRVLLVLLLVASLANAEYVWNGSDWIWNEPDTSSVNKNSNNNDNNNNDDNTNTEGSGYAEDDYEFSGDDEDDDDDEDYSVDNERRKPNVNTINNRDPVLPPFIDVDNDIDFVEDVDEDVRDKSRNSNNNNNNLYDNDPIGDVRDSIGHGGGPSYAAPSDDHLGNRRRNNHRRNHHATSFFAQPGTLAAVVGGAVVGLLCAILCVMFIVYRMRKKDEGSYALDEHSKRASAVNAYVKPPSREFFA